MKTLMRRSRQSGAVLLLTMVLLAWAGSGHGEEKNPYRNLAAVFHPEQFPPFAMAPGMTATDFNHFWKVNRPWVLANLSHAAYHPREKITELMTRCGAGSCYFYNRAGAQAFLAIWPDKAVLVFRGTQVKSTNDLAADLLFVPTPYGSAIVHRGFLRELDKIWEAVAGDIKKETHDKRVRLPVWATGHSMGGALATLAGTRFSFKAVITFGEPPVGRGIGSMFLSDRHIRYINGDDPIPKIPGIVMAHHGTPIRITGPSNPPDWRYDHSIIYYAENLFGKLL